MSYRTLSNSRAVRLAAKEREPRQEKPIKESASDRYTLSICHAAKDGDCNWLLCPQIRDGEPAKSGRHCPLDYLCSQPRCLICGSLMPVMDEEQSSVKCPHCGQEWFV